MISTRNPFRKYLRNVHVRRIFMITMMPLWILVIIPIVALKAVWEELENGIPSIISAIKDGNSYD